MKSATLIRVLNYEESGNTVRRAQGLYRLSPPFIDLDGLPRFNHVVVSAISGTSARGAGWDAHQYSETYIFPADENGHILEWIELSGSYKGGMSHQQALSNAGYALIPPGDSCPSQDIIPEERWHSICKGELSNE